jgi:hypothetical protein
MPEKYLFEYAIIRVVPKIEREEFLNVGVILYCKGLRYLGSVVHLEESRLQAFYADLDLVEIRAYLDAFDRIGKGDGPIGKLTQAERFRWLTATRSTIVQTSRVHPGFTTNPSETLAQLHQQMVL